ncbi:flagellar assembly protein FliH [Spirochaeta isovalerica]|uniref:Flagellar assembly protein FliH n=1 Tax=Spirochaeta isovalerica TaxID=150 RepID=A0A841RGQ0_9SPIO|nr:flagellar assembly protein FliH [Spirochaeta isovalerica]
MAKSVFRPQEIVNLTQQKVKIEAPVFETEVEEVEELEEFEYTGPTAEDLKREADAFKASWEREKQAMIEEAQARAEAIIREAEETAFEEVRKKTDQATAEKQIAEEEALKTRETAEAEAARLRDDTERQIEDFKKDAYDKGYEAGREEGFKSGEAEVARLIERIHTIMNKSIEKRVEIIEEAESQLIDLVLQISRKVIKVVSENQKNVVINNVVQALRKMKSRGDVAIKVNLADLEITTEHTQDFLRMVENVKSITVLEDSSVDKGGCIIETDFGQIDARISSQLKEIEEKILDIVPIKTGIES